MIKNALQAYDFIDFALLFGSYANETQNDMSDVDIGIYVDRPIDLFEQGALISELEDVLEKKVDLLVLNDLYKENPKMAFNIVDNHTLLFCHTTENYLMFKTYTYKYYFDQKPMFDMFDQALRERIESGTYGKTQTS
ncbi:type VII toxin-antitoxin system MntA family adenylyltransferase antitoxin [Sulfurovum riftiae]|uniref:Polymerase beta nucleotidyltransferase domain-containing protein n=1 Tax=Sulfurovum riftiae TaxID=1630136 RepID=A0A151CEL1_9BACT|nr:nucleotidyltransferase domain-containing protein [Sulfurovum riftiae]KYJ85961.1 hypothetical protein AS592_05080 [Sulfurovum riftiae]